MGPTNAALVKLFRADQKLREAQARLETASRDVRVQERRVAELTERLKAAQQRLREQQSQQGQLELDLKARDAHIEKLRTQQQNAKNHKEYQAFLVEINTSKVDKGKVEDQAIKTMEAVETAQKEVKEVGALLETERTKLATLQQQIGGRLTQLQAEIDQLKPQRDAAYEAVPPKGREAFDRLSERFEGEALSAMGKPDRRREEYICEACNMSLVTDVYNRLHSRDDLIFCPSCKRILYIPEDLPVEAAVNVKGAKSEKKSKRDKGGEKVEEGAEEAASQ